MTAPQLLKPSLLVPPHLAPLFLAFAALSEKVCGKKLISRGWTLNDRGRGQCFRNRQYVSFRGALTKLAIAVEEERLGDATVTALVYRVRK